MDATPRFGGEGDHMDFQTIMQNPLAQNAIIVTIASMMTLALVALGLSQLPWPQKQ